jgi:hypothetical protein
MCTGTKAVKDIIEIYSREHEGEFDGIPPEKACIYGLRVLKEQGLIGISSRPTTIQ